MKIVQFNFEREINASYDSVMWNYWDHEHLHIVHNNYTDAKVFYEDDKLAAIFLDFKLPIFSFISSKSLNLMYLKDRNTVKVFNTGMFGLVSETTIKVYETSANYCKLTMNYKFYLKGWKIFLSPFLKKMASKWNQKVWIEDLNLKIRRTKVLNSGFQDFKGMNNKIFKNDKFSLPIKRHPNSPVNFKE